MKLFLPRVVILMTRYSAIVLLIICVINSTLVASEGNAQKYVSVYDTYIEAEMNNLAFEEVFNKIKSLTDYTFSYNSSDVGSGLLVNLDNGRNSVADVLLKISSEGNLQFKQVNNNISVKRSKGRANRPAQLEVIIPDVTINGTITDETGAALVGVSVVVRGTAVGTITDLDGSYAVEVPENSVLIFSYIGYKTSEVNIAGRSVIDIRMEQDVSQLSEVVVTALGIERNKQSLSYAVSEVDGAEISQKAEPDVLRALSGRVAGVNITSAGGASGSSTNIVIRGNNSATGNNQPLFVVDGIPFDNSLSNTADDPAAAASTYSNRALDLDPNDIKTMTVLKGGAAAALYGSRASNGVVLITTYSGSRSQKGLEVELSNTVGFERIARLPNYQNRFGQGNTSSATGRATFSSAATESWGPEFGNGVLNGGLFDDGGVVKYNNHLGDDVPYQAFPDNVEEFFQTGAQRETAIKIRGGGPTSGFAIVASNVDNSGFLPFTGLRRTSVKTSGNTILENGLDLSASATYVNTQQDGILSGGHNTLSSINRQTLFIPRSYDLSGFQFIDPVTGTQNRYTFWDDPNWLAQEGPYTSDVNRFYGNVNLKYDINDWLNVAYRIGANSYTDFRNQIIPRGSFNGPGNIVNHTISFNELNSDLILTGSRDLSSNLNLRFIVGQNYNQRTTDEDVLNGTGIIKRGITRISNAETIVSDLSRFSQRRIIGTYADVTLSYRDWLFLNATGRNDWSSTLPEGSRSFFYPSVSAAFVFTDAFDIKSNTLSSGKLRVAFAKIGNDADPYLLSTVNEINGSAGSLQFPFGGVSASTIGDNAGNVNLRPEFTTEWEIGAEIRLFNNKLGIDAAVYDKVTKDQIFSVNVQAPTGFLTQTLNAGEIANKGVELGVDFTPISTPNGFSWTIFAAFSRNVSRVNELADGIDFINPGFGQASYGNVLKVGEQYGVFQAEVATRDESGNLLINPATGLTTKAPLQEIVGDPNPDFMLGVTNAISYKGLAIGALLDFRKGGDIMSLSAGYLRGFGITEETTERDRSYIIPGILADPSDLTQPLLDESGNTIANDVQITPQEFWAGAVSGSTTNQYRFAGEAYVFDATVLRLRELTIGYEAPREWFENSFIGSASITLIGRNLWFKAPNMPHIDPEVSTYGAGNAQGVEQYAPPTTKNYSVNIRFTF